MEPLFIDNAALRLLHALKGPFPVVFWASGLRWSDMAPRRFRKSEVQRSAGERRKRA